MRQIVRRYAAYILVGFGLVGYGLGCETQGAQEEEDEPVVEQPDQEEMGDEQARSQRQGEELPSLSEQELGQQDQQPGEQPGAGQQQEQPEGPEGELEVRGQTAGEAQLEKLEQESVAGDLKLESTEITDARPGDDQPEYAEFCFESEIEEMGTEGGQGFYVQGYSSQIRVSAQEVSQSEEDASCLQVGFAPGTALDDYSVGVVAPGVIMNAEDEPNAMDSAELEGASGLAGRTSAPELTEVEVQEENQRAVFVFDQPIQGQQRPEGQTRRGGAPGETAEAGERVGQGAQGSEAWQGQVNPDWLGYYTTEGRAVTADEVVGVDRNRVELQFETEQAEAEGQEGAETGGLDEAVRWFAHRGAVMDRQGEHGVITSTGQKTDAPDLMAVDRESETEWMFEFDQAVAEPDATNFALYTDGGQMFQGAEASVGEEGETVQVTCPDGRKYSESVTMAAVAPQAVRSDGMDGMDEMSDVSNTIGASEVEGPAARGPTSGPDLVGVEADSEQGQVTFQFDEMVNQPQAKMEQEPMDEGQQPEPAEPGEMEPQGEETQPQGEMDEGEQQPAEGDQPMESEQQEQPEPGEQQEPPMDDQQPAEEGQQPEQEAPGETEPEQTEPGQPQEAPQEQAEQEDQPAEAEPEQQPEQQTDEGQRQAQQPSEDQPMGGEMAMYVITEDGEVHSAGEMVAPEEEGDGDTVTVTFPEAAMEAPARFVVGGGVVEDQIGNPNPPHTLPHGEETEMESSSRQQGDQ